MVIIRFSRITQKLSTNYNKIRFILNQDSEGNTPFHLALLNGSSTLIANQFLPRRWIDYKLHNNLGFNVLHLAVVMDDLK